MIMEIGNLYYYLSIVLLIGLTALLYFIVRNKNEKVKFRILLGVAFANFALHFLKILHPTYMANIQDSLCRMSAENICALSTIVLPFVMLSKNKVVQSYFYMIAFFGGLMAVLLTTEPNGRPIFEFNSIRYYVCHYILFAVPTVATLTNLYKPDFKVAIWMPLMFLIGQTIILLNELFLGAVGLVDYTLETFLSADFRNPSFVFGPNHLFGWMVEKMKLLVPPFFTKNIFGIPGVGDFYWPVVWMIIPVYIFFPLGYILVTLPFTKGDIKAYLEEKKLKKESKQVTVEE